MSNFEVDLDDSDISHFYATQNTETAADISDDAYSSFDDCHSDADAEGLDTMDDSDMNSIDSDIASDQDTEIEGQDQRPEVKVVEYKDPLALRNQDRRHEQTDYRRFMSSKPNKIFSEPSIKTAPKSAEEREDDMKQSKLDKELETLLGGLNGPASGVLDLMKAKTPQALGRHLEQVAVGQLHGRDRRAYMNETMSEMQFSSQAPSVPRRIAQGMMVKSKQRFQRALQEQKDNDGVLISSATNSAVLLSATGGMRGGVKASQGVIFTSTSHPLHAHARKQKQHDLTRKILGVDKRKWDERGMRVGVGQFKDGVLKIGKRQIEAVAQESAPPAKPVKRNLSKAPKPMRNKRKPHKKGRK